MVICHHHFIIELDREGFSSKYRRHMFIRAAGIAYFCEKDDDVYVLLGKRSTRSAEPGQWATIGGKIERGETPKQAALREVKEEIGFEEDGEDLSLFYVSNNNKCRFFCYEKWVDEMFSPPSLDKNEHSDCKWFKLSQLPSPVMKELQPHIERYAKQY